MMAMYIYITGGAAEEAGRAACQGRSSTGEFHVLSVSRPRWHASCGLCGGLVTSFKRLVADCPEPEWLVGRRAGWGVLGRVVTGLLAAGAAALPGGRACGQAGGAPAAAPGARESPAGCATASPPPPPPPLPQDAKVEQMRLERERVREQSAQEKAR